MQKTRNNNPVNIIIAVTALCLAAAAFITAYYFLRPRGEEGAKTILVEVAAGAGAEVYKMDIHTDAAYLRQALEEAGLIGGDDTEFGFWVTTVNGYTADSGAQEWWALYKNGEFSMTGAGDTPIENGDKFQYILVVGYDNAGG